MTTSNQGSHVIEKPSGQGWVFKGQKLIGEVAYELEVIQNIVRESTGESIITGKIRRIGSSSMLWGTEQYTLHLKDKRKLDFFCVNFDPDCNIASDRGFYT
jgi:hypothetical protein